MIRPPWAVSVWYDSDWIYVEMKSVKGALTHRVRVTNDIQGLQKVLILLRTRNAESRIASGGEPLQCQIERIDYDPAMVRRPKPKVQATPEQRAKAKQILRDMGLIR